MNTLNVVVASNIPDEYLHEIETADPRLRVKSAGQLFRIERQVAEQGGKATPEQAAALKELEDTMREAEVIYALRLPRNLAQLSPKLKWVQFISAGVESISETRGLSRDLIITNASGTNTIPIVEQLFGFMLMFVKQTRRSLSSQASKKWDRFPPDELAGKTVGLVGLGNIGSRTARLARALSMRVLATRRSATRRELNIEGVDEIYPVSQLGAMFAECDFVVIAVPLTPETTGMIGEPELRAMKPTAYFINVARGTVVDQTVLIKALKEGWIAGAALDVTEPEPLPAESELWQLPNVIITAHIAGGTFGSGYRTMQLFCDNLKRYLDGKPLANVVDRARGY